MEALRHIEDIKKLWARMVEPGGQHRNPLKEILLVLVRVVNVFNRLVYSLVSGLTSSQHGAWADLHEVAEIVPSTLSRQPE